MAVARHPWYFETDSAHDALDGRRLLERYLSDHCEEGDLYPASLVFGELLSNVIKHAPQGGGVRVWLEPEGDRFALCFKDAGKGFNGKQAARPSDSSESGRGLFIVQQICDRVSFKSVPGSGFIVRAVLPLRRRAHR